MGTAVYLCSCGGGNERPLIYFMPQTTEKYGDFASTKVQGNCEGAFIVCSLG